jgi:cytoskeletal protein CcmA (bactofilin family)
MAWFDRAPGGKKEPLDSQPVENRPDPVSSSIRLPEEAPPEVKGAGEEMVAHLYKGSRVTGQLTFHGLSNIDGTVEGEIVCHGTLTVGEDAEVKAKISANVVVIRGRVDGDVIAKERVEMATPARLFGNIETPRLIVMEGVVFEGHCSMSGAKERVGLSSPRRSSSEKALQGRSSKLAVDLEK